MTAHPRTSSLFGSVSLSSKTSDPAHHREEVRKVDGVIEWVLGPCGGMGSEVIFSDAPVRVRADGSCTSLDRDPAEWAKELTLTEELFRRDGSKINPFMPVLFYALSARDCLFLD